MSSKLHIVPSRSGQMNVEVAGKPYHSPYDPRREAQKFYGAYPVEKADVILHFGWGLGYAGEILKGRIKASARVIIFEPDEELFRLAISQPDNLKFFQDHRFQFVTGQEVCQFFDSWTLDGCQESDEFLWLIWPAAQQCYSALASTLMETFKVRLRDRAGNLLTHFKNGRMYFENVLANLEYQGGSDAGRLFARFKNIPLVIVSAGPSLDRNIYELRNLNDRCFVLAVDTALRPLLAAGIEPDAVIIADPTELNARHVAGVVPDSTYLIAEQAVHASALRGVSRRFLYGLGLFPDPLFAKFGFAKSSVQVWGSVATAALDLAVKMGANPIIFAGQDFGYSWDRDYASHTIFEGNNFSAAVGGTHLATDIWGRETRTTENLIAYRDFFVRRIRQTSGIRFINATEGGILTEAVEILSLRDALHQSRSNNLDVGRILTDADRPSLGAGEAAFARGVRAIEHLREILTSRSSDCSCLHDFLELTAKEPLLKKDDDAVNKSILWGWRTCEEFCRTHAEGGAAPAYRGHARAGVDV